MKLKAALIIFILSLFSLSFAPKALGAVYLPPQCADGVDNDGDSLIDLSDPGCSSAADDDEYNAPSTPPPSEPDPEPEPPATTPTTQNTPQPQTKKTTPVADTTKPEISDLKVSDITSTKAVISWKTNEEASGTVFFGKSASYGQNINQAERSVDHHINLTGLEPNTTYYFKVESADVVGNTASLEGQTFTTSKEVVREATRAATKSAVGSSTNLNIWPWLIGILIGLGLLAFLGYLLWKRKKKKSEKKKDTLSTS